MTSKPRTFQFDVEQGDTICSALHSASNGRPLTEAEREALKQVADAFRRSDVLLQVKARG